MTENDPAHRTVKEAAEYIAALTQELATLAARNNLDMLGYLLEMACVEARETAHRETAPRRVGRRGAPSVEAP
ncbi:hypothetical protein [Ancylobacter sp.]|uniref:hypothetical protein n=1 Tax=Ancylobacter sp. TaxID=1872567 RepID=UPI003C7A6E45